MAGIVTKSSDCTLPPMPEDVAALCERLRALVIIDEVRSDNPLARDAADTLEVQAAEIARLTQERDEAKRHLAEIASFTEPHYLGAGMKPESGWIIDQWRFNYFGLENDIESAEAEIARLKEALKPFAEYAPDAPESIFPNAATFTHGSPLAKRQLTFGDLRAARAALDATIKE